MKSQTESDLLTLTTWKRISYQVLLQATNGFRENTLLGSWAFGSVYKSTFSNGIINVSIKACQNHWTFGSIVSHLL